MFVPAYGTRRAGHAAAPTNEIGGASRPSSVMAYAMTPSPRGRLAPRRFLRMELKRAGHAAAPTRKIACAYRPSSGRFAATFPQGKAFLRRVGTLLRRPTVPPLRATQAWPTSPYTGEAAPRRKSPRNSCTSGHAPPCGGIKCGSGVSPGLRRQKHGWSRSPPGPDHRRR